MNLFGLLKGPGSIPYRVDLGDPHGFGYALRWWHANRANGSRIEGITRGGRVLYDRWLAGTTTDPDRLALAKACAEVAP